MFYCSPIDWDCFCEASPQVQCFWPLAEITPTLPPVRESWRRLLSTAARAATRRFRPIVQYCWSHRRWRSITSKGHQRRTAA